MKNLKFIANVNVEKPLVDFLARKGFDIKWVANIDKIIYGIILLRIKGQNTSEKIILIEKLLDRYPDKITNHFVVVTKKKFRFIPMEMS